ncbi:MAG: endonuclease/exonuclease/phosphatase family protein [Planctomycetota bacterium]|jgi:endonuclease/exonuclease/phosphatase family metal-dependent hydrolase/DNA/RNA endonuclease YhcR with UshA esterase domain
MQRSVGIGVSVLVILLTSNVLFAQEMTSPIGPDEGRPHIDWRDAGDFVGEIVFVYGKIVRVGHSRSVHFLNFDNNRDAPFTAIVFEKSMKYFPESLESLYENRIVRIRGMVSTYAGKPQIAVGKPDQIKVLESLPEKLGYEKPSVPKLGKKLKIASFNILNLFDTYDAPEHGDEATEPKNREEIDHVAETIRKINPDVIALQEIENQDYLEAFRRVCLKDMGYEIVFREGNDRRGIDVALMSRVPVGTVTSHRHVRFPGPGDTMRTMERDLLQVMLHPPGSSPLELWVVHLKSNYGGREHAEPIRMGEARYIRSLLDQALQQDPDARIVVLGDFNDTWESETMQTIVGSGATAMAAFFEDLPDDGQITYNKGSYRSMIDFIIASPSLAADYVKGSYAIVDGSVATIGSDHNPISAEFSLK